MFVATEQFLFPLNFYLAIEKQHLFIYIFSPAFVSLSFSVILRMVVVSFVDFVLVDCIHFSPMWMCMFVEKTFSSLLSLFFATRSLQINERKFNRNFLVSSVKWRIIRKMPVYWRIEYMPRLQKSCTKIQIHSHIRVHNANAAFKMRIRLMIL